MKAQVIVNRAEKHLHFMIISVSYAPLAQMAELVDALASGASDRMVVEVQVLFWAPHLLFSYSRTEKIDDVKM